MYVCMYSTAQEKVREIAYVARLVANGAGLRAAAPEELIPRSYPAIVLPLLFRS